MRDRTALVELANFTARSSLASGDLSVRNKALAGMRRRMIPRKRSVGDLLGMVLTLSARTRRMAQQRMRIELDVFAPGGARALTMFFGEH